MPGSDVFYFGNAIGESGDSASDAKVTVVDEIAARFHAAAPTIASLRHRAEVGKNDPL